MPARLPATQSAEAEVDAFARGVYPQTRRARAGDESVIEKNKMAVKLKAAEDARQAADRVREQERYARMAAEEDRDKRYAALHRAGQGASRLDKLLEEYGR